MSISQQFYLNSIKDIDKKIGLLEKLMDLELDIPTQSLFII